MKKKHFKNEEIEQIMHKLLKTGTVQDEIVEKIIASPKLFDSIQNKINAEISETKITRHKYFWNWQTVISFLGILSVLTAILIFNYFNSRERTVRIVENNSYREFESQIPKTKNETITHLPSFKQTNSTQPIVLKKPVVHRAKPIQIKQIQPPENKFIPINFAEDLEIAKRDGSIIRVNISRTSLLALGVDLSAEDEKSIIKTEFLISSDGIPKGVRLVK